MAAVSARVQKQISPNAGVKVLFVSCTSAADADTLTVSELQKVEGCFGFSTTGVAASYSFTTNVITLNNGGALNWTFLVWGY
jgi:hypothetical protein